MILPQSPPWMDGLHHIHPASISQHTSSSTCAPAPASTSTASSTTVRHPLNGQLSPISTGMDMAVGHTHDDGPCPSTAESAAARPMSQSESSSVADSWSMIYGENADDVNATHAGVDQDMHWDQDSEEGVAVPKVEPMDEEIRLDEIKEAPPTPVPSNTSPTSAQPKAKRPRGRPRKHPLTPVVSANKITKGRSKTGCLTCRKRKKKCDEAKPRCMSRGPTTPSSVHSLLTTAGRHEL
jgi:hypothetical protein